MINRSSLHRRYPIVLILCVALLLRTAWALVVPVAPVSDSVSYDTFARNLIAGEGYAWVSGQPTAYWPPGTSFIYAAIYWLCGETYVSIAVFQVFLGVLVVYLSYRFALIEFDESIALIAAALLACWPLLIEFTTVLASELLFLVPILLAALVVHEPSRSRLVHWAAFGVIVGVAVYIRPTALPLIVVIPVFAAIRYRQPRYLNFMVIGGLLCITLLMPWSIRNTNLFGEFTLVSTNFGTNLWMGNNPASTGAYQSLPVDESFSSEKEREDFFRNEALRFIASSPGQFVRLAVSRARITFDRETIGIRWNGLGLEQLGVGARAITALKAITTLYWYLMAILALGGLTLYVARQGVNALTSPAIISAGLFASVPVIVVGQDRYHMAVIPVVAIFAAVTVARMKNAISASHGNR